MNHVFNIRDAKAKLSMLVAKAEAGEDVIIARAGKPVVKLVALPRRSKRRPERKPGFLKGRIWIGPDFDNPLSDDIQATFRDEHD